MSTSAFYSLTLGSSTNSHKHSKQAQLFKRKPAAVTDAGKEDVGSSSRLPVELDFFASGGAQVEMSGKRKRDDGRGKGRETEDMETSEEEEDESDEEPSTPPPAPPAQKITLTALTDSPLPTSIGPSIATLLSQSPTPALARLLSRNLSKQGVTGLWGVQGAVAGGMLGYNGVTSSLGSAEDGDEAEESTADEQGRNLIVVAPTGSGKTLAYLLPLLLLLSQPCRSYLTLSSPHSSSSPSDKHTQGIRSIILLPTLELAHQILSEVSKLLDGGRWRVVLLEKKTEAAVKLAGKEGLGIDVLVATPERLHALVSSLDLDLSQTRHLILDEADHLLSHQFLPQVQPIVDACAGAQKVFLSATMEAGPEGVAREMLDGREGVRIVVGVKDAATITIDQSLHFTGSESGKLLLLRSLLSSGALPPPCLIFCQSIDRANALYQELLSSGVGDGEGGGALEVGVLHSGLSRERREDVVRRFRKGEVWVLIGTEGMGRGLDFKGVGVVVNYDFPQTAQSYIHRIGRTGRAGRQGKAITFFTLEDGPYLRTIANILRASGCAVPGYMLELPKPSKNLKKARRRAPIERKDVGGGDGSGVAKRERDKKRDMVEASKKRKLKGGEGKTEGGQGGNRVQIDMDE